MGTIERDIRPDQLPLSKSSKRVIEGAKQIAKSLDHNYVGPEHLLLSLITEKPIIETLRSGFGISHEKVRGVVRTIITPHKGRVTGTPGLTFRYQRVIELADLHAQEDHRQEITELDLLVGIIRERGVGAGVLATLKLDEAMLNKLKTAYIRVKHET